MNRMTPFPCDCPDCRPTRPRCPNCGGKLQGGHCLDCDGAFEDDETPPEREPWPDTATCGALDGAPEW